MRRGAAVLAVTLWLCAAGASAHEERLMVGRVEVVEPARKLLVVVDAQRGDRRRLEVNQETEVLVCRTVTGLGALGAGRLVRVTYVDRPGAEPEALSILLLRQGK